MAPTNKTPSLLPELRAYVANIENLPYDKLLGAAADAGWQTFIQQTDQTGQADGTVLVTFQVFVGRDDKFEPFDLVSVKVAPGPSPVSAVARRIAHDSLVPLFFGRYPSAPLQQPAEQINVRAPAAGDIVIPDDEQEYVDEGGPVLARPDVIDHMEPDGVPIFADLYEMGVASADVIAAVLDEVDEFLQRAQSVETINAMGLKNPMMIKFVKDLGTPEDSAALMDMITRRRNLVAPPVLTGAGRRRSAAQVN